MTPKYRNTKQKAHILSCLENAQKHLTAEDIIEMLKARNTPVARATIYRYLSKLEEEGLVRKYAISENRPACFQLVSSIEHCMQHFHLLCLSCEAVIHFDSDVLANALAQTMNQEGLLISNNKTVFYGLCKECKLKMKEVPV